MNRPVETIRPAPALLSPEWHILLCIAAEADVRVATIARRTGQTERSVARRIGDLVDAGIIVKARIGRCNRYVIDPDARLTDRSPITVGRLLKAFRIEP